MAPNVLRLCAVPGCPELVSKGRCAKHIGGPARIRLRESAAKRGYDAAWQRCRDAFLRQHPLCHDCGEALLDAKGKGHVHHVQKLVDRPDLRLDWNNLMALCDACHAARTNRGE